MANELDAVIADAKRMAVEAGENSPLGYTLAVLVDALAEAERRLDGYSAMCAEQEARAEALAQELARAAEVDENGTDDLNHDPSPLIHCTCPEGFHTPGEGCEADE